LSRKPSSEQRFDALPDRRSAVTAVLQATRMYAESSSLVVLAPARGDDIPVLDHATHFRYADQYQPFAEALGNGEQVTIVTVLKDRETTALGFAEVPSKHGVEIMTIDVVQDSRRSAGAQYPMTIDNETFEIGVGHVLVLGLMESIHADVLHTNATTTQARYLFKSLGFVSTDSDNSCLLQLRNT